MLLKLVLPPFTYELLTVVKVLITTPIHEAGLLAETSDFGLFFSFNSMVEGFYLIGW